MNKENFDCKVDRDHIFSGLNDFDTAVGGFTRGNLYAFCGRPAMGKSTMILTLMRNIAVDEGIPIALFSLEMSSLQIVERLSLMGNKIEIENAPSFIDDTPGLDIHDFCKKTIRLVYNHNITIIFIDYLQLMNVKNVNFESRYHEISYIVQTLKELAIEVNVPIVVTLQLNCCGKRPTLNDLKDASAIMEYADVVAFLHRPDYYRHVDNNGNDLHDIYGNDLHGKIEIIVEKNRIGKNTSFYLNFDGEHAQISNI